MPGLVGVDLGQVIGMDDRVVMQLAIRCERLQGLNLSGCKAVGDGGMKVVAARSKMLRRVGARNCFL